MRMRSLILSLIAFVFLCSPSASFAWPPEFGREMEFTNETTYTDATKRERIYVKFLQRVREKCLQYSPPCKPLDPKLRPGYDLGRIEFPDGFWVNISTDPAVIEVQTRKSTLEVLNSKENLLQNLIFDTATELNLRTDHFIGQANHLNISLTSFENAEELFRYLVDYANHPELASGILGKDYGAANPLNRNDSLSNHFKKVLDEVKSKPITLNWAIELLNTVYSGKSAAINTSRASSEYEEELRRIEMRAIKMMPNAREDILMAELQQKRLEYLRNAKPPIEYIFIPPQEYSDQELAERFAVYLSEMDAPWDRYSILFTKDPSLKPSAFFVGVDQWMDPNYVKTVKARVSQAIENPSYQKRLLSALSKEEALSSGKGVEILGEIASRLTPFISKKKKEQIESLLAASLKLHDWRKSPQEAGLIAAIDRKLHFTVVDKAEKIASGSCLIQRLRARFSR